MTLRFAEFTLDLDRRLLLHDDGTLHLSPKAFDLLALLIRQRPNVVSKEDLFKALWPDTFVTDNVLATLITDIRAATRDNARRPRFVRTAHGCGYAFNGEIVADGQEDGSPAPWFLLWDHREIALRYGKNILGRRGDGVVVIDSSTVSKRHARLVVAAAALTVEDLGSKNGTWIGERAVTASTPLQDGDRLRLGSVLLTVCSRRRAPSTDSVID